MVRTQFGAGPCRCGGSVRKSGFFRGMRADHLEYVASCGRRYHFSAGQAILSLGPGNHLSPWVGLGLLFGYAVASLAIAAYLLVRRDT